MNTPVTVSATLVFPETFEFTQKKANALYLKVPVGERIVLSTAGIVTSVLVSDVDCGGRTDFPPPAQSFWLASQPSRR